MARDAGVSVGSLYQYFADREAILAEVRERHGRWLASATRLGMEEAATLPLRARVRASIERMVALHGSDDRLRQAVAKPLTARDFEEFRERTEQFLRTNADEVRPLDPSLAATVITRAAEAVIYGVSRDEPEWMQHAGFIDEVTELVVGYLAPRGAGGRPISSRPKPPRASRPSEAGKAESSRSVETCPLCGRDGVRASDHHLVPRSRGGTHEDTVRICTDCHDAIHEMFTNKELAERLGSVEALLADERFARHARWLSRQKPGRRFPSRRARDQRKRGRNG